MQIDTSFQCFFLSSYNIFIKMVIRIKNTITLNTNLILVKHFSNG